MGISFPLGPRISSATSSFASSSTLSFFVILSLLSDQILTFLIRKIEDDILLFFSALARLRFFTAGLNTMTPFLTEEKKCTDPYPDPDQHGQNKNAFPPAFFSSLLLSFFCAFSFHGELTYFFAFSAAILPTKGSSYHFPPEGIHHEEEPQDEGFNPDQHSQGAESIRRRP